MSTAIYVAVIEGNQDEGYGAFFPDLPGCVTAAETMLELPAAAREALSLHLSGMIEDAEVLPEPTPIEAVARDPEVAEVGRMIVDVEIEDAPVRVNISVGGQFLRRVDVAAEARGMTRSGFLVEAARRMMAAEDNSLQVGFNLHAQLKAANTPRILTGTALSSGLVIHNCLYAAAPEDKRYQRRDESGVFHETVDHSVDDLTRAQTRSGGLMFVSKLRP